MDQNSIDSAADEWYEHHRRKIVWFTAIVDEKTINCGISLEALRDHFGAYYDDPLPAFRTHRAIIQEAASRLMMQRRFEDDGTVLIRSADFAPRQ